MVDTTIDVVDLMVDIVTSLLGFLRWVIRVIRIY